MMHEKSGGAKKHILVVSQYFYPEQFRINDITQAWIERGYRVTVLTGIPNYPNGRFYKGYGWFEKRREQYGDIKILRIPIIPRGSNELQLFLNFFSFVLSGFFWQVCTSLKADLVFVFEVSPMSQALPAVWFSKRRKIPCVIYVQDLWPESFQEATGIYKGMLIDAITWMVKYIYRHCQKVFISSFAYKEPVESLGVSKENIIYWPQYAEDFYIPTTELYPLMMGDEVFSIAFTGNIGYSQGLEMLPRAANQLKQEEVLVRFVVVGNGRGLKDLKCIIEREEVSEYFLFISQVPAKDIPKILAGADVGFISFSAKKTFELTIPAKLQSYMACGLPVIAAARGATRQIVLESGCGLCCDAGDVDGFVKIIKQLRSISKEQLVRMGERGRHYQQEHFHKDMLMTQMDKYLNDLTGESRLVI